MKQERSLGMEANKPEIETASIDEETLTQKASGIASSVFQARLHNSSSLVAIKTASSQKRYSPEPHDILKEIAILSSISHANIIDIILSKRVDSNIELWTPWITYNLGDFLDKPTFSPHDISSKVVHLVNPRATLSTMRMDIFKLLTKSIIYQTVLALDYLHGQKHPIGHRDIKPRNLLLTESGCVKLIDFGITFHEQISPMKTNLWPESAHKMYNDVATGPFRAPELLFGPERYDTCATDLWSLGCTVAHFFTSIRLFKLSRYDEDEDDEPDLKSEEQQRTLPYILPKDMQSINIRSAGWTRAPLFDGTRGSIGLAASIFKLRGTPNTRNWPEFMSLPDADKIQFTEFPTKELYPFLPNLPPGVESSGAEHAPPAKMTPSPLDLVHRLLIYPPNDRLRAASVLKHPWFLSDIDCPLLLPSDHPLVTSPADQLQHITRWKDESLGHWLGRFDRDLS